MNIAVIGGGITGLATAWYAQRGGATVEVFEAGDAAGGAGGDSLGGADALYRGSGGGSVSSIDGRKMLRSKTLKP